MGEALRIKKKYEADINEMEIALDHANKAHAEAKKAMKRTHMQLGDVNAAEEIERDKANVAGRLAEAEDTVTSLGEKIANLEKSKARAKAELDDLTAECERHLTNSTIIERRGRNFDKVVNEWRLKAEDL